MASSSGASQLSLARFAFNIYGSISANDRATARVSEKPRLHSKKLRYNCDREITCLSQLRRPIGVSNSAFHDPSLLVPSQHVIIGGKNYLKLLALNYDQSDIVADINLIESPQSYLSRLNSSLRLFNANTIKCKEDLVACGLTSGNVQIYQIAPSGKAKLTYRLEDHKRVINSLDFVEQDQMLLSGSQDGTIRLWDLRSYKSKPVIKLMASQHSDPVRSCQYSPHSKVRGKMSVLSVHDSGALCKFDLRYPNTSSGSSLPERKWTFHTGPALSLHIHPESEYVLTGGRDRKICVWNYGDTALSSMSPDFLLNTYGPVMKIRWNETPNDESLPAAMSEFGDDLAHHKLGLFNFDFACLYLNDDPSITVYNLARRFVPKEIVNTLTRKPFQNFVWAKTGFGERKLWTITKSNVFVSYDLDSPEESLANITKPFETLPPVSTTWGQGFASLSLVSQEGNDFDLLAQLLLESDSEDTKLNHDDLRMDDEKHVEVHSSPVSIDNSNIPMKSLPNSYSNGPTFMYQKSQTGYSPKERPALMRLATQLSLLAKALGTPMNTRPGAFDFAPPPSLQRPTMNRNHSQSTMESNSSGLGGQAPLHQSSVKKPAVMYPTPFLVSMSIPLPLADESVFTTLATEYLFSIPDGFLLSFVCQINARVAAGVQQYRDCQVWRMISVALEQEEQRGHENHEAASAPSVSQVGDQAESLEEKSEIAITGSPDDARSISSELGNFVGSYNSDSTLTNYGSGPRHSASNSSVHDLAILGSSRESTRGILSSKNIRSQSSQSLIELAQHPRSFNSSPHKPHSFGKMFLSLQPEFAVGEEELALIDEHELTESDKVPLPIHSSSLKDSANMARRPDLFTAPHGRSSMDMFDEFHSPDGIYRKDSFLRKEPSSSEPHSVFSKDLDNENMNVLSNAAASYSSSALRLPASTPSSRNRLSFLSRESLAAMNNGLSRKASFGKIRSPMSKGSAPGLSKVDESVALIQEPVFSQLTKSLHDKVHDSYSSRPWDLFNLVKHSLEHAMSQGDLVMCATLILLFHDHTQKHFGHKLLREESCLECLGLYIETLRKKDLLSVAVQIVKDAPRALKYKLGIRSSKEVDMRFYCCWCQKLLSNEASKVKYGPRSEKFGFWYCEECSRKQLNCVYCNEPCKGLTVVESLACGHWGHFGCFQEWHIEENNFECPGGCE